MKILGINDGHDCGIALINNGRIEFAINEERISRIKMDWGFPELSLKNFFILGKAKPEEIDFIAIGNITRPSIYSIKKPFSLRDKLKKYFKNIYYKIAEINGEILDKNLVIKLHRFLGYSIRDKRGIKKKLLSYNLTQPVRFYDHQFCHICSAYYTSGFNEALVVSLDGGGDGYAGAIYIGKDGNLQKISSISKINSIGVFWSAVTEACGFNSARHGGKITGLAAYGDSSEIKTAYQQIKDLYSVDKDNLTLKLNKRQSFNSMKNWFEDIARKHGKAQLAYGAQKLLEKNIVKLIRYACEKFNQHNVALAGGVFANVRLNQKILESGEVSKIFVHPNMGDGGKALGAAFACYYEKIHSSEIFHLKNVYLGPNYKQSEIERTVSNCGLKYEYIEDIEMKTAELLYKGKSVSRFSQRMEYGPRALGNRSILYTTADKSVNDWLNERLHRTEFMPFAPAVLEGFEEKCFKFNRGGKKASEFMTITFDCTDWFKEYCPGVVHIDGTARPQVVRKEINPSFFRIIDEYRKLTGLPAIINTSFNMHEEPIVNTPLDAITAFKQSGLDYLAIDNFLVDNK